MLGDGSGFPAEEVDEKFMETCRYCLQIYADLMENILQVFDPDTSFAWCFSISKPAILKFVCVVFLRSFYMFTCFFGKTEFP